ncbi:ABC transporter substrate-binding protein [uncultured Roseobacter sp.]|uniref:ABC transporter substrate-binding protein n=1 Tax=uncultured Roseobacter sp. TaxID=114847 RepID=UPI0026366287|nr:ABC transporter substrate-binding protein [uncultured Roseobacter sp.]
MFKFFRSYLILLVALAAPASGETLRLYIDADYSISRHGAEAIELGVTTALSEVGSRAGGFDLEVLPRDHRANSKRSLATMRNYLRDPKGLAVIGGVHSPPYLTNKRFINENGVLLLLPWSAAGPITRADDGVENWIYRLSVDDTKAGPFLVARALSHAHCARTALLLVDTGWGRANKGTMRTAFETAQAQEPYVFMFPSSIGAASARTLVQSIARVSPDCVIMLASAAEGALLLNELHKELPSTKVISHWGILAADFEDRIAPATLSNMDLEVLQTCGLEQERQKAPALKRALDLASDAQSPFHSLSDIPASTGFVHGYDLTRLLLAAIEQSAQASDWAALSIQQRRAAVRLALTRLEAPVDGILKTYAEPFAPYSPAYRDAHEALGLGDLCMASFDETGRLVLVDHSPLGHL